MIGTILGAMIGGTTAVFTMCLCVAAKDADSHCEIRKN
ncbi:MAG: DUF3789 domain-containing protein [Ruminococcus sp.]|nr:DUF3789 domain-containing protein [Ruminococcus sp.]